MVKSIITNDLTKCYICGSNQWIELHHIFGASNRKKSSEDGLVVPLCHYCHNEPPKGIHHNRNNELKLKKQAELKWCEYYKKTPKDFVKKYYRNYI